MNTDVSITPNLWRGLASALVDTEKNFKSDYSGAFVHVFVMAKNDFEFRAKVSKKLSEIGFLLEDFDEIEVIEVGDVKDRLSDKFATLATEAIKHGDVIFDEFYTYNFAEEEVN